MLTIRRLARALTALVVVAGGAAFVNASAAYADTELELQPSQVGTTAGEFPSQDDDCENDADQDGWHFVAPSNATFVSLTVTFDLPGGGEETVTLDDPSDFGPPDASHAFVITEAGATLTGGTAVVEEDIQQTFFVLSHTCPGTPGEEETPSETPSESPSESPTTPGEEETTTPAGGVLPKTGTGFPVVPFALLAMLLIGAGTGVLMRAGVVPMPYRRKH